MYKAKTMPTEISVASYLDAIEDASRRDDCRRIADLMQQATGCAPAMWGTSIVGFDRYHYRYDSGHEGDACLIGFSSRKSEISVYLMPGYDAPDTRALLQKLGKHGLGKSCLRIKRLADVDVTVLDQLIRDAVVEMRRRYPG